MARNEQFKIDEILAAIEEGHTPTGAAHVLRCHADTIRNYAKRYPKVDAALKSKRRDIVDLAESGLRIAVLNKEAWAIAFALKTLGKDDGYTERQEVTGANGDSIVIRLRDDDHD